MDQICNFSLDTCSRKDILLYMAKLIMISYYSQKMTQMQADLALVSSTIASNPFIDNKIDYTIEVTLRKIEFKKIIQKYIKALSHGIKIPDDIFNLFCYMQKSENCIQSKGSDTISYYQKKGSYTMNFIPLMDKYPELFIMDNRFPDGECFKKT